MDSLLAVQLFGSQVVGTLADELGQEIAKSLPGKSAPDQALLVPKWDALIRAIRRDLHIPTAGAKEKADGIDQ